jgi:hypothetical protein
VGAATDVSGNYLLAFGKLFLDAEVEVTRSGCLLGYLSLVALYAGFFPCKGVADTKSGANSSSATSMFPGYRILR